MVGAGARGEAFFGVQCKTCTEVFSVGEVTWDERGAVWWPSVNYKESRTCPKCAATHDYSHADLTLYMA
jgi:heterodisulfide reductase subunit A-like polyferredoxin